MHRLWIVYILVSITDRRLAIGSDCLGYRPKRCGFEVLALVDLRFRCAFCMRRPTCSPVRGIIAFGLLAPLE